VQSAGESQWSQAVQNVVFNLKGTNRTLNQPMAFTGNFVALSNSWQGVQVQGAFQNSSARFQQQNIAPTFLNQSAIQGQLRIGNQREMEFNALPSAK
jgi:hypothetical protein